MDDITKHESDPVEPLNPNVDYEHGDVNVFAISKFGIGLAIGTVVAVMAMWGLFDWFYHQGTATVEDVPQRILSERPKLPPEPRLQSRPKIEIKELRESEDKLLSSYAWIDPDKGMVRIPVEQAIGLMAAKGYKSRPGAPGLETDGYRMLPSKSSSGRTMEKQGQ